MLRIFLNRNGLPISSIYNIIRNIDCIFCYFLVVNSLPCFGFCQSFCCTLLVVVDRVLIAFQFIIYINGHLFVLAYDRCPVNFTGLADISINYAGICYNSSAYLLASCLDHILARIQIGPRLRRIFKPMLHFIASHCLAVHKRNLWMIFRNIHYRCWPFQGIAINLFVDNSDLIRRRRLCDRIRNWISLFIYIMYCIIPTLQFRVIECDFFIICIQKQVLTWDSRNIIRIRSRDIWQRCLNCYVLILRTGKRASIKLQQRICIFHVDNIAILSRPFPFCM